MATLAAAHSCLQPVYCCRFDDETVLPEIRRRETPGRLRITTVGQRRRDSSPPYRAGPPGGAPSTPAGSVARIFISFPIGCCVREGAFLPPALPIQPAPPATCRPRADRTVLQARTTAAWPASPPWCSSGAARCGARLSAGKTSPTASAAYTGRRLAAAFILHTNRAASQKFALFAEELQWHTEELLSPVNHKRWSAPTFQRGEILCKTLENLLPRLGHSAIEIIGRPVPDYPVEIQTRLKGILANPAVRSISHSIERA